MPTTRNAPRSDLGMALDPDEHKALETAQIRVSSRVFAVRQTSGKSVYRFDESGGAVGDLGHYAGILPLAGHPLLLNRRLMSFSGNKEHRRVITAACVRFQVFRYRANYVHAYVTLHANGGHHLLFLARFGEIDKDNNVAFPPDTGIENKVIPSFLVPGFQAALEGARHANCTCASHFTSLKRVELPEGLLSAFHIEARGAKKVAAPATSTLEKVS